MRSVLVTDSGLGGLSVAAALAERFRRAGAGLELTYFNAWPEQERGFNRFPSQAEGLRMIHERMLARPGSQVILFGTLTTIASEVHRNGLIDRGIAPGRIVAQACDRLAAEIEQDPESRTVQDMIGRFVAEAVSRLADPGAPVLAAFCCTHYNYSAGLFRAAFAPLEPEIVNPNEAMGACLEPAGAGPVRARVLSRIVLSDQKVAAMVRQIRPVSPPLAEALIRYRHDPDLFTY